MLQDMWKAMRLDVAFFEEVEHDTSYTSRAATVVGIVAVLNGLGNAAIRPGVVLPFIAAFVSTFLGWLVWSWLTAFIARTVFGGTTDTGEMLRVLGFAYSPMLLGIIPFLIPVAVIWSLVIAVVAIRQAGDFSTGKAIGTVLVGWLIAVIFQAVRNAIL